ncbi:MAG: hypothetical protein ACRDR6_26800 [Pseudonocardiaceae bacterium]
MTVETRRESGEDPVAAAPPAGYTLVLPPAWRKIPVRRGTDQAIRAIVDQVFSNLPTNVPRDKVAPYRKEVQRQLTSAAGRARRSGAVDLYLPVELMLRCSGRGVVHRVRAVLIAAILSRTPSPRHQQDPCR